MLGNNITLRQNYLGRKVILLLSLFIFHGATAQNKLNIISIEKLEIVSEMGSFHPVLSNLGDFICYSSYANKGLFLYDFSTKQSIEITPITNLCTNVLFSESDDILYFSQKDILKKENVTLKSYDLKSGELSSVKETEDDEEKSWWDQFTDLFSSDIPSANLNIEALKYGHTDFPYVKLEKAKIVLVDKGGEKILNPADVQYYIHPSLSPNSKKITAQAIGKGTFVYDTNTTDYISLENFEAPEWISNSMLIGMKSEDDGHKITKSTIVYFNLNSKEYTPLFNDDINGMFPRYYPKASKIVFHTPDGRIYMTTIELEY